LKSFFESKQIMNYDFLIIINIYTIPYFILFSIQDQDLQKIFNLIYKPVDYVSDSTHLVTLN